MQLQKENMCVVRKTINLILKTLAKKRNIFSMYINLVGGGCLRTKDCSFILPILEENQYIKTTDPKYFLSHHMGENFPMSPHALFI